MKSLLATTVSMITLLAAGAACAVDGHIANAGQDVESGGWAPVLFAVLVFGLVSWVLAQLRKPLEGYEE